MSDELIEKFSRRTAQIEQKARDMGLDEPRAKAELGAKTREPKQTNMSLGELQESWSARMTAQERAVLEALAGRIGGDGEPVDDKAATCGVERALSHCFERQSVVPERKILEIALRRTVGKTTMERIRKETSCSGLIVGELEGRRMVTTAVVLGQERRVVAFAKNGRGTCAQLAEGCAFENDWLTADQQKSARALLESRDRVMLLRGRAGTGKTTLMKEVVAVIEEAGTKVFAFAPSAAASRGVLRQEGFEADTVARLLVDEKLQARIANQLIWIDEAGLLGMKTLASVFALAEKLHARILLTGDRNQHGPVERGAALRLLEEEAGLKPADLKDIQRQRGEYRAAVQAFAEGMTGEGFDRLDRLGWVREIPEEERYRQLATDYVSAVAQGKSALVVSPTHAEAARIDHEIRDALRQAKVIGAEERTFRVLQNANLTEAERRDAVNYRSGDVLQFHQNAKGFIRGERLIVNDPRTLPLDQAARFQVFHTKELKLAAGDMVRVTHNGKSEDGHRLDNGTTYRVKRFDAAGNIILTNGWTIGRDFGHLAYGYVVTSHASQGRTVDRVFIGQSSESFAASSREQIYVSCSRAREAVTVYTDDKEALRQAINRTDDRLTATEFVNSVVHRQMMALHVPSPVLNAQQATRREGQHVIRDCA